MPDDQELKKRQAPEQPAGPIFRAPAVQAPAIDIDIDEDEEVEDDEEVTKEEEEQAAALKEHDKQTMICITCGRGYEGCQVCSDPACPLCTKYHDRT